MINTHTDTKNTCYFTSVHTPQTETSRVSNYVSYILLRAEGNITVTHFPDEYT